MAGILAGVWNPVSSQCLDGRAQARVSKTYLVTELRTLELAVETLKNKTTSVPVYSSMSLRHTCTQIHVAMEVRFPRSIMSDFGPGSPHAVDE